MFKSQKIGRRNKLIKSVGASKDEYEIKTLYDQAYNLIPFYTKTDLKIRPVYHQKKEE